MRHLFPPFSKIRGMAQQNSLFSLPYLTDLTLTAFVVFVLLSQVSVRYLHSAHGKCLNREKKRVFFTLTQF